MWKAPYALVIFQTKQRRHLKPKGGTLNMRCLLSISNKIAVVKILQILTPYKDLNQANSWNSNPTFGSHLTLGPHSQSLSYSFLSIQQTFSQWIWIGYNSSHKELPYNGRALEWGLSCRIMPQQQVMCNHQCWVGIKK